MPAVPGGTAIGIVYAAAPVSLTSNAPGNETVAAAGRLAALARSKPKAATAADS
jgi:hypothetical protein